MFSGEVSINVICSAKRIWGGDRPHGHGRAEGGYLLARNFHGFLRLSPMDFAGLKSASKAPQAQEAGLQAHRLRHFCPL